MKSAVMILESGPISLHKLPNRSDSEEYYRRLMEASTKAEAQAILKTDKLYGPFHKNPQRNYDLAKEAIEWAFDCTVISM
jgi:hypothetical protein